MEIHRQKCQSCGSRHMRNILLRDRDEFVYVQCQQCRKLVARYGLAPGGYFHFGKGFESFLRSIKRMGEVPSGRDLRTEFNLTEKSCLDGFEEVIKVLRDQGKDDE